MPCILLCGLVLVFCVSCGAAPELAKESRSESHEISSKEIATIWGDFATLKDSMKRGPNDPSVTKFGALLQSLDPELTFEIGPGKNSNCSEIAITPNGHEELFPLAERIVKEAPKFDGWEIVAFRQRAPQEILKNMKIGGTPVTASGEIDRTAPMVSLSSSDLSYTLSKKGAKADLVLYFRNGDTDEQKCSMAKILLAQALGEYDMVRRMGEIRFAGSNDPDAKKAKPFVELPAEFDRLMSK
jgi:hypothetical protein